MNVQLIFCLETSKAAGTDWVYVKETISRFFVITNKIKYAPIYMNSKNNYNSAFVNKEIAKRIKDYRLGKTYVFYCIDVDDFESNPVHVKEFKDISAFCKKNGYSLVWFCHDIEDVYLNKRIHDTEKVKMAGAFRQNKCINQISKSKLESSNCHKVHSSNILGELSKYLERK